MSLSLVLKAMARLPGFSSKHHARVERSFFTGSWSPLVAVHREQAPLAAPVPLSSASVGVINQHAIAATGALILTKHLLHPKSDPKSEGGETWAVGGDGPAGRRGRKDGAA